jgi:hypothetical protein
MPRRMAQDMYFVIQLYQIVLPVVLRLANAAPQCLQRHSKHARSAEARMIRTSGSDYRYTVYEYLVQPVHGVLWVRLSTPGRHPKTSGFDVAEGRI